MQTPIVNPIRQGLISVSDTTDLDIFADGLDVFGVKLMATTGTASFLEKKRIPVTGMSADNGFPVMLDGLVKTLNYKVHAGIVAKRDNPKHMAELETAGIDPIDLVVVTLYDFEKAVAVPDCTIEDALKSFDLGGVALLRSAIKSLRFVTVVCDPADYPNVLLDMGNNQGAVGDALRRTLANKAAALVAAYDAAISRYFNGPTQTCHGTTSGFSLCDNPPGPSSEWPPQHIAIPLEKGDTRGINCPNCRPITGYLERRPR